MRKVIDKHSFPCSANIGAIKLNAKSRDDIPTILMISHSNGMSALKAFLFDAVVPGTEIRTEGWGLCERIGNRRPAAFGDQLAHEILPWTATVFSSLKRWGISRT